MTRRSKYEHRYEEIESLYKSGLSVWKIQEKTGINGQTVYRILLRLGATIRSKSESIRTRSINEKVFEKIDTHEKAYYFGLLYSDGGIVKISPTVYTIGLTLHNNDIETLNNYRSFLGSDHKINERKDKQASSLVIANKKIISDLMRHGITLRKSLTIGFPKSVSDEFMNSFILGLIDGDGSIYARERDRYLTKQVTVSLVGSENLIRGVAEFLNSKLGLNIKNIKKCNNSNVYKISIEGRLQLKKLLDYLYKDFEKPMKRKKDVYIKYIK